MGQPSCIDALDASVSVRLNRDYSMQYRLLLSCVAAILSSAAALVILYRHAETIGLVDRPSERKKHVGNIPLIGGLAVFLA
jgi:UDP-GlcNAc:undecaprenyl-phosphate GlcNAc-1-phosphate transferase